MKQQRSRSNSRKAERQARRLRAKKAKTVRRFLSSEQLEDRALLAGDLLYHNTAQSADVDGDGQVTFSDALMVISQLRQTGPGSLASGEVSTAMAQQSSSTGGAEGEPSTPMFVDVDGDDYLSFADALAVISTLRAEGAPGDEATVRFEAVALNAYEDFGIVGANAAEIKIELANPANPVSVSFVGNAAGAPLFLNGPANVTVLINDGTVQQIIDGLNTAFAGRATASLASGSAATQPRLEGFGSSTINLPDIDATEIHQGDSFTLRLFVQDTRPAGADRGVLAFDMDINFDANRILSTGDPTFRTSFNDGFLNTMFNNTTGVIEDFQALWLSLSQGGDVEQLAAEFPFLADALRAVNDTFMTVDSNATPIAEDPLMPYVLDVMANDLLNNGTANISGEEETENGNSQGFVLEPASPATIADPANVDYGNLNLDIVGGVRTLVSFQGTSANGGTITLDDNGTPLDLTDDRLFYDPADNFFGPDSFTYVIGDGVSSIQKTGTVVVTVAAVNDPPTINMPADEDVLEDSGAQMVDLTGITAGGAGTETQPLTVTVQNNSNPGLFASTSISYVSDSPTGTFHYTPADDASGTATITLEVSDGDLTTTTTFDITVTDVNDPPIPVLLDFTTQEDTPAVDEDFSVLEAAILSAAPGPTAESGQTVTVTQINNTAGAPILDPSNATGMATVTGSDGGTLTFDFDANGGLGLYTYTPALNFFGVEEFTYILQDSGDTANGGMNTATGTVLVTVTAVNDAPEVDLDPDDSGGDRPDFQTTFTEDVTPSVLIGDLDALVVDVDDANIQSLTLTLTNHPDAALEFLSADTTGTGITASTYNSATGELVLSGDFPFGDYQTVLRTVRYHNTSDTPSPAQRHIRIFATDDDSADSATVTSTITVNPTNDPPVLSGIELAPLEYDENEPATQVSGGISVADPDDMMLEGGLVQITGNYANGQDVLSTLPTLPAGITAGAFNTADGSITLSGSATLGDYQTALRSIAYSNTSEDPSTLPRTVSFTVFDGDVNSNTLTRLIDVISINDAPTLDPLAGVVLDEDALEEVVNLAGIGTGGEAQNLTVTAASDNTGLIPNPTVTYNPNDPTGSIAFTPVGDQSGTATITVTVMDDGGTADTGVDTFSQTFVVTVNAINDAPTLNTINDLTINEDALEQTINLQNITAGGGETQNLMVTAVSDNMALIDPMVSYTPNQNSGTLTFTPTPQLSGVAEIVVTVTDDGPTGGNHVNTFQQTFHVTVNAVNDEPTLNPLGNLNIDEEAPQQSVNLEGISSGAANEMQTLMVTAMSDNTGLIPTPTITYASDDPTGTLTFTPVGDQSGVAVITVTVTDDGSGVAPNDNTFQRSFTVTVNAINDAPTLAPITNRTILEDDPSETVNLSGISAGGGETQILNIVATSDTPGLIPDPTVSYVQGQATGSINFAPVANQNGTAIITVVITDDGPTGGTHENVSTQSFTVTVTAVNDEPTLNTIADPAPIDEDAGPQNVGLAGITAGPNESQTLMVTAVSSNPGLIANPTVTYASPSATGMLTYTPAGNQSGTAVITVTVTDSGSNTPPNDNSIQRSFTVTVNAVNDAPQISVSPVPYIEGDPATVLDDQATLTDVDTPTVVSVTASITGNFNDGQDLLSAVGTALVDVAISPNGQTVTLTAAAGQSPTIADFQAVLRTLSYENTELVPSNNANRTVTVTADDGTATPTAIGTTMFDIEILPPELPFARDDRYTVLEDSGTTTLDVLNNDRKTAPATLTITGVTQPPAGEGTVAINGDQIDYTTSGDFFGTTTFTYVIDDDDGATNDGPSTGTVTVTVTGVNDEPELGGIGNITMDEDEPDQIDRTVDLTGIGAGPMETQNLTFSATSSNTTLIPDANLVFSYTQGQTTGTLEITPAADLPLGLPAQTSVITVVLTDDGGADNSGVNSTTQTFTVTVNPVNDPPTIDQVLDQTVAEDSGAHMITLTNVTAGGGEAQGLDVSASASGAPVITNVNVVAGVLSYETVADQFGVAAISVVVQDAGLDNTLNGGGDDGFTTMSFDVTVTAVNDEPTLSPIVDPTAILEDAGQQMVSLGGISAGGGESQTLSVVATSDNPGLIPNPTVNYISASPTGSLTYTPVANQNGTAVITVVLTDSGPDDGTAAPGDNDNNVTQSFTVTVTAVNDEPTLDVINDVMVDEDDPQQSLVLTGITSGQPNENQNLTVTAVSNDPGIVPDPTIVYNSADSTATLQFTPVADQFGVAEIVVTVTDDGGTAVTGDDDTFERTFNITVNSVNDAPTLTMFMNRTIAEDGGELQHFSFSAGPGNESGQNVTITAVSSNPTLIPDPTVNTAMPGPPPSVNYFALPDQNGVAVITVTAVDDGGTVNGGEDTFSQTFTVTVTEMNDDPIANDDSGTAALTTQEDVPLQIVQLTLTGNDFTGPPDATDELANQSLTVIEVNGGVAATAHGTVSLSGGVVTYTPDPHYNGTDTFSYVIEDDGTTAGTDDFKTATAMVTVTITAVNDPPIINSVYSDTTLEDTFTTIALADLEALADPGPTAPAGTVDDETSQDVEVFALDNGLPGGAAAIMSDNGGLVEIIAGDIVYTPAGDFNGPDTFRYLLRDDGAPMQTVTGVVNISVTAVNDAPNTFDRLDLIGITNGGGQVYAPLDGPMPDNPGPADEAGQTLTLIDVQIDTPAAGAGTVVVNGDNRTFTYTPAPDFEGVVTFTYTVMDNGGTDNGGIDEATGTVQVDVKKFLPSTFSGYVFIDANANNIKDAGEVGLAGITVSLEGVEQFGPAVMRQVTTSADGYYNFDDVRPGEYDVFLEAIPFLLDGNDTIHTPGTTAAPGFNEFQVGLAGYDRVHLDIELLGGHSLRTDFGKIGLGAQFISLADFWASGSSEKVTFGVDASGAMMWHMFGDGWFNFIKAEFQLSADHNSAVLKIYKLNTDNSVTMTEMYLNSTQFNVKGTTSEGSVVELLGSAASFGLAQGDAPVEAAPTTVEEALEATRVEAEAPPMDEQLVAQIPQNWQAIDVMSLAPPTLAEMLTAVLPPSNYDSPAAADAPTEGVAEDESAWDDVDHLAHRSQEIADQFGDSSDQLGEDFVEALDAMFGDGFDLLS
ncbi:MAG: Ig-like domain-containing protein [Pirellulaceae bacterium]